MIIVDTHCHAGSSWFEPVDLILFQMDRNDVDKAVLMQHRGTYDARYLLECVQRFPDRFVPVVIVDTNDAEATNHLEKWKSSGAVGVRLGPTMRSPGSDPLAIWRKVADLGMVVSCQGKDSDFATDEFRELVGQFPETPFIIEHLAGAGQGQGPPYTTLSKALSLAELPNTYIKVPGLGEISARPDVLTPDFRFNFTPPLIEMAYDAFGASRMMFGSDYPPVSNREGYRNALNGVMRHPTFSNERDLEWVIGKTALKVFDFD